MRKKKIDQLINNIILSIRYMKLEEEVSNTKDFITELEGKDKLTGKAIKQIVISNDFIERIKVEINKITIANPVNSYRIIVDDKLPDTLNILSRSKDYEFIKFRIALEIITDRELAYTDNTKMEYIDNISEIIFKDKQAIKRIAINYKKISNEIMGIKLKSVIDDTGKLASKTPIKNLITVSKFIPNKQLLVLGSATAIGSALGYTYYKLRKQAKKMSEFGPGDLANRRIIDAIHLLYAKKIYTNELRYLKYTCNLFKQINLERMYIVKNLFEKQYEVENHILKMKIFQNFDNYIMNEIKTELRESVN